MKKRSQSELEKLKKYGEKMNFLEKAMDWAKENKPDASLSHKCAFANSVQYLCTGASGGYGGPSLREHLVSWALSGEGGRNEGVMQFPDGTLPRVGDWGYEEAIAFCTPLCFEPLSVLMTDYGDKIKAIQENEYCFDDAPDDLEFLRGKS